MTYQPPKELLLCQEQNRIRYLLLIIIELKTNINKQKYFLGKKFLMQGHFFKKILLVSHFPTIKELKI